MSAYAVCAHRADGYCHTNMLPCGVLAGLRWCSWRRDADMSLQRCQAQPQGPTARPMQVAESGLTVVLGHGLASDSLRCYGSDHPRTAATMQQPGPGFAAMAWLQQSFSMPRCIPNPGPPWSLLPHGSNEYYIASKKHFHLIYAHPLSMPCLL